MQKPYLKAYAEIIFTQKCNYHIYRCYTCCSHVYKFIKQPCLHKVEQPCLHLYDRVMFTVKCSSHVYACVQFLGVLVSIFISVYKVAMLTGVYNYINGNVCYALTILRHMWNCQPNNFFFILLKCFFPRKIILQSKIEIATTVEPSTVIVNESYYTFLCFKGIRLHAFWSTRHERLVRCV